MNYYRHHIGDFRSGTVNMSRVERWIYRDLLEMYYDAEQPIPLDIDAVCYKIGVSDDERNIVERLLRFKFEKTEHGYINGRCEAEIDNYHNNATNSRTNGRKGGRPRKQKTQPVLNDNPEKPSGLFLETQKNPAGLKNNPDITQTKPNHKPLTINHKPKGTNVVVSQSRASAHEESSGDDPGGGDLVPKDPAQWCRYFAERHGVELDARSIHDRKKVWPIFAAWTQAGITIGQMNTAVAKAQAEATEPIAFLPAYVDRVLATMRAPPQRQRDGGGKNWHEKSAETIAILTGSKPEIEVKDERTIDL